LKLTKNKSEIVHNKKPRLVAFINPKSKKIACVLLQAVLGGDSHIPSRFFDTSVWEVASTDGMIPMHGTIAEWKKLGDMWSSKSKKA
jgi:hypothetical protein